MFRQQAAIRIGEDARKLTDEPLQLAAVAAIDDDGQGELAKRLAFAESPQTIAEILDIDLFRSSTNTSRGFALVESLPSCEMKPVFEMLKWRRRLFTSFRALSVGIGAHSVTT